MDHGDSTEDDGDSSDDDGDTTDDDDDFENGNRRCGRTSATTARAAVPPRVQSSPSSNHRATVAASSVSSASSSKPKKRAKKASATVPAHVVKKIERGNILDAKIEQAEANGTLDSSLAKWNAKRNAPLRTVDRSGAKTRVMMDCVVCRLSQPLKPEFFEVHHGGESLATSAVGHESFRNSPTMPCLACKSAMHAVEISTVVGWVNNIIKNYPQLSVVWFWLQWKRQGGDYQLQPDGSIIITRAALCNVTELPMTCVSGPFMASINNRSPAHSAPHLHVEEHCELVCVWANVRQEGFPDLNAAFLEIASLSAQVQQDRITSPNGIDLAAAALSAEIRENWSHRKEKHLNGVTANSHTEAAQYRLQIHELDVYSICAKQRSSHAQHDEEDGRVPAVPLTAESIMNKWSAAPRCAHSHVLTTIRNGPRRVSLDRIAHGVAHEVSTTVIVCRMLNPPSGMSRAQWCSIMSLQKRVPLTDAVRASFKAEAGNFSIV